MMMSLVMSVTLSEWDCIIDIIIVTLPEGKCIIDIMCVLVRVAFPKEILIELRLR